MKQVLLNLLISLFASTWRIKADGDVKENSALIGFWHGEMLPNWYFFRKRKPFAVISLSKDGELLSSLLRSWGLNVRRGSSSQGGKEVLKKITNDAKNGLVLITPDGPRGPKNKLKAGIVIASQRSGSPFYFINTKIHSKKVFQNSWDNFQLPLPFSKIELHLNGPFFVDKSYSREEIENFISELNQKFKPN